MIGETGRRQGKSDRPGPARLVDYTSGRLRKLCAGAGFRETTESVVDTFRSLVSPWADQRLDQTTPWVSEISDDSTPIELSVALAGSEAEVRVLFEPQGADPTLASYRTAALELNRRLQRDFGAHLGRLRQVQDLFAPADMAGPFAIWSSAVFRPTGRPSFKAYLNPQAHGPGEAEALVKAGLERLGMGQAWRTLSDTVLRRGPYLDELKYFALDLSDEAFARVKVYVRHHESVPSDLENAASAAREYVPGEVLDFVRGMRGGDDCLHVRASFSCSSFVGDRSERPAATTVYVPVCAYARDDAAVRTRVSDYLSSTGLDPSAYLAIIDTYANRPLDAGIGMQSWVALRRYNGVPRLTVYLATEARRIYKPGEVPAPTEDRRDGQAAGRYAPSGTQPTAQARARIATCGDESPARTAGRR
jgi:hypothetical protein